MGKNVFIDGHKRPDIIENYKHFFQVMKNLEPYLVEFDKTNQIVLKIYLSDYKIG